MNNYRYVDLPETGIHLTMWEANNPNNIMQLWGREASLIYNNILLHGKHKDEFIKEIMNDNYWREMEKKQKTEVGLLYD